MALCSGVDLWFGKILVDLVLVEALGASQLCRNLVISKQAAYGEEHEHVRRRKLCFLTQPEPAKELMQQMG